MYLFFIVDFPYFVTYDDDGSYLVIEKFDKSTWIEWNVRQDQPPKMIVFWKFFDYTEGNGILILYDKSRKAYTKLTTNVWFLKFEGNEDFWIYRYGKWSNSTPIELE